MRQADVIIPVYRPTEKLIQLMEKLREQTVQPERIILINTEQRYFDDFWAGRELPVDREKLLIRHIAKEEFDHGGTRNLGVELAQSPYFVMMTDDAVPADAYLLERLLAPFEDEQVAMSYARQLAAPGCGIIEEYTRQFNYPNVSVVKSKEDIGVMGIKAFFASNVCAAYRRDVFLELKGFCSHTIFNEDMIYARGLLDAGWHIAYAADAGVLHSHNYTGLQQLKRNFDLGVSHVQHPEVFGGITAESEGARLIFSTCRHLLKVGKPWLICKLVWQSGCKYLGYLLGKHYRSLPMGVVKSCSMNRDYWKKL